MRSPLGALATLANKSPVPHVGRHAARAGSGLFAPRGQESQLRAMGSVGTLFAIVDRLASSTAAVDWDLYRQAKPDQRPEDREHVTSHPALDLWNGPPGPNKFFTRSLLIETSQQHYELVGEMWWVIARHPRMRSIPLELWPVRPDRMQPVPDPKDYLVGYVYTSPDGEQIPLGLDDVIFIRRPNPWDSYRGIGPVQTILADLEGVRLSSEWNRNFFLNSAEPGGIVRVDRHLNDDEFNELRDRWNEQHRGVAQAHRVAILEAGEWVDRKFTNRDIQFVELRAASRETIREAFGLPKFAIGDVEDVNRATALASKAWFAEQMTVPRLERIKQALNTAFLPLFGSTGKGVEFDYESPVPEDSEANNAERESRASTYKMLRDAGVDPEDAAEVAGLPPMRVVLATPVAPAEPAEVEPAAQLRLGQLEAARPVLPLRILAASPDHSTGCMLALYPPPELAAQLAVPDGVDDLHLTVAYCGKADDVDAAALLDAARAVADRGPITGEITGVARFTGGDDGDVIVALVDSPALEDLRRDVRNRLAEHGVDIPRDHGYLPHITLTYLESGAESPVERLDSTPVSFEALGVVHGDDRTDVPFMPSVEARARAGFRNVAQDGEPLPDLEPVRQAWETALADLLTQWAGVRARWHAALVTAVHDLVATGQREQLPQVEVPEDDEHDGHLVLNAAMIALAIAAARRVVAEAAAQGVEIDAGDVDGDLLDGVAGALAASLARDIAIEAGREGMRVTAPGDEGDTAARRAAEAVRIRLEQVGETRYRTWLGNALIQAEHAGRTATMRDAEQSAPTVAYYASEQLDGRTCALCREVNGRWLGNTIGDALDEYPVGGYVRCLGGPRCRGLVVAVYRPQQVRQAGDDE